MIRITFSSFSNMKVCSVFSLESSHRGDSNEYIQHTIINKKTIAQNYPKYNKASKAIQSPRTVPFFLLISSLDGY